MPRALPRRLALILPACHEEETIGPVLDELLNTLGSEAEWTVGVGVNGSPVGADRTAALARAHPLQPIVAETAARGYGYGCQAAIEAIERLLPVPPDAYIFFAADGANTPADLSPFLRAFEQGHRFITGCRTGSFRPDGNRRVMGWAHLCANRLLGAWCGVLTGHFSRDIGPLRLIERNLFHRLRLREWTFGWTIEAQVTATRLGCPPVEIPVTERPRLAGEQKVSKVSWQHTLYIGWRIFQAGWRTRLRPLAVDDVPCAVPVSPRAMTR